ncbi:hypothetical protein AGMMS50233_03150 [Endomicrobiia bacterium]|nr:hypothetical protein AGMMS50233_03150 [Endomicrobiia bacterium]
MKWRFVIQAFVAPDLSILASVKSKNPYWTVFVALGLGLQLEDTANCKKMILYIKNSRLLKVRHCFSLFVFV